MRGPTPSPKSCAIAVEVMPMLDLYFIRLGQDGLAKITARRLGEIDSRSWLVPAAEAEDAVLDDWARVPRCPSRLSAGLVKFAPPEALFRLFLVLMASARVSWRGATGRGC